MFGWRKKYNVLFWIVFILCLTGVSVLAVFNIIEYLLAMILSVVIGLILAFEMFKLASAADQKMYGNMRECRIEPYIKEMKKIYDGTDHYRHKRVAAIDLACGYILQGKFKEAVITLNQYGPLQILNPRDLYSNAVYYSNLADAYFKLGELQAAEEATTKLVELFSEDDIASIHKSGLGVMYLNVKISGLIANGRYSEAAVLLEAELPTNVFMVEKVSTGYDLAVCYENLGENQKAKELLEFVAANGGDTCYAQEAGIKLANM